MITRQSAVDLALERFGELRLRAGLTILGDLYLACERRSCAVGSFKLAIAEDWSSRRRRLRPLRCPSCRGALIIVAVDVA